ncbi:MAG: hypothetical protein JSV03_13695 [Planctomycetota bacterium]|nr:MAG: hypothetical protein JSV03_13695 [Planctomycetota bacterium]
MAGIRNLSILTLFLAVLLVGCQSPELQKRNQRRVDNIHETCALLAEGDTGRMEKMTRTLNYFDRHYQVDLVRSRENLAMIPKWIQDDFDNWKEREPIIRRDIREGLTGNMANFNKTLPVILD